VGARRGGATHVSESTKRTWIALAVAEGVFSVAYTLCAIITWVLGAAISGDAMFIFGFLAVLYFYGLFALVVAVPIVVHTVGRLIEMLTRGWSQMRSALVHMAVGLVLGGAAASLILPSIQIGVPMAFVAFSLPAGLTGLATRLIVPQAMRRRWIVGVSAGIAAVPLLVSVVFGILIAASSGGAVSLALLP